MNRTVRTLIVTLNINYLSGSLDKDTESRWVIKDTLAIVIFPKISWRSMTARQKILYHVGFVAKSKPLRENAVVADTNNRRGNKSGSWFAVRRKSFLPFPCQLMAWNLFWKFHTSYFHTNQQSLKPWGRIEKLYCKTLLSAELNVKLSLKLFSSDHRGKDPILDEALRNMRIEFRRFWL